MIIIKIHHEGVVTISVQNDDRQFPNDARLQDDGNHQELV